MLQEKEELCSLSEISLEGKREGLHLASQDFLADFRKTSFLIWCIAKSGIGPVSAAPLGSLVINQLLTR